MRSNGIRIIDYVPGSKISLRAIRRIRHELKNGAYDVVYAFNNKAIANTAVAVLGLDVGLATYRGQTANISRWDPACYLTHLNPRVDMVICVADAVRDSVRAQHRRPECVATVYKGHDLAWYSAQAADLTGFGVPADAFVVGCVANNRPRKGLSVLVEAGKFLPDAAPIHFILVGSNMDDPRLSRAIAESPWRNNIHVLGFREDVPALIAACNVTVLPSIKREGLPKTVIESMAYGVPAIVTNTGGSPELVLDGDSGIVVPTSDANAIADAIMRLWQDPVLCKQMGARARERIATRFRVEDSVSKTRALLEQLVARRAEYA
jgi:glycosyltransferase involved in cell wall biosynthesis